MNNDVENLKEKISGMSDENLLKMIKIDFAEYREEAIELAKKELENRNIQLASKAEVEELVKRLGQEEKEKIPEKWLNLYTYFRIPLSILRDLILIVKYPSYNVPYIIFDVVLLYLFFGLHKRRLWGWKLNWIVLMVSTLLCPLDLDKSGNNYFFYLVILSLVWLLPNCIYFKKRRHLFSPKAKDA